MKTKDIARVYNLPQKRLDNFLRGMTRDEITYGIFADVNVLDTAVPGIVEEFRQMIQSEDAEFQQQQQQELEKRRDMSGILITSGFNFDGFKVVKYSGYISGDDAIQVDRGQQGFFTSATNVGEALMNNLSTIRRNALQELKEQAYALGCNAIIGVDFDYPTLDPETVSASGGTLYMPYVFGVTANGNAVIIEKDI